MDLMKVIDQTVREIKREVNLKVLKVPEIEQKVLDATDNEPWGPHGTSLVEIAQATKKYTECQMVMNVLWTRLRETGKDWRYVYKALTVVEYLIGNGSERAVDDIINHSFQISSLIGFEYVEPNGKDMGINVRKKAEKITALLNDKEKIQEARNKAAATREKYIGLSSTGMSYQSSAASYSGGGGGSFQSSNSFGGFSSRYDTDSFKDSYRDKDEDQFEKYVPKSRQISSSERKTTRYSSKDQDVTSSGPSKSASQTNSDQYNVISQPANTSSNSPVDDDDDDFDPRGTNTSNAKPATGESQQVDLFGESLMGDFLDASSSSSVPPQSSATDNKSAEVDLFSDTDFVSAAPKLEAGCNSQPQANIDLFSTEPASSAIVSPTKDFFASPDPVAIPATKSESMGPSNLTIVDPFAAVPKSESTSLSNLTTVDPFATVPKSESSSPSNLTTTVDLFATVPKSESTRPSNLTTVDPFATVPKSESSSSSNLTTTVDLFATVPKSESTSPSNLTTVDPFSTVGSDLFGGFTSHTDESSSAPKQEPRDISTVNDLSGKSMSESKAPSKKDGFQVKSGIWADSLSRGLIDLNISGPKKVNLADVGIIGDLTIGSEVKQKGPTTSYYMGSAMGTGSGVSRTRANPTGTIGDDFFSSLNSGSSQYQLNGFQK